MRLGMIAETDAAGFDYVVSKKLDFIEAVRNHPDQIERFVSDVPGIRARIQTTGIDIPVVGRWGAEVQKNGLIAEEEFSLTKALLNAAIAVGARTFVCGCNYDPAISLYQNYTVAIRIFDELLKLADGKIQIAVYNCEWKNFVYSPEQWKVVLGELPQLKIKYDAAHTCGRKGDYLSEINTWHDRIAHVHLKGYLETESVGWVDFPPAGMDQIDWKGLISLLYAKGYDGNLSLEPHSEIWKKGSRNGEYGIDYSISYFNKLLFRENKGVQ